MTIKRLEVRKNGDTFVGYVEFWRAEERDEALKQVIGAVRSEFGCDLEVLESIPNDEGFLEPPSFIVYRATKSTPNVPEYKKGFRHPHECRFLVRAMEFQN